MNFVFPSVKEIFREKKVDTLERIYLLQRNIYKTQNIIVFISLETVYFSFPNQI